MSDNDPAGVALRDRLDLDLRPLTASLLHVVIPRPHNDVAAWRAGMDHGDFDEQLMEVAEKARGDRTRRATA